MVSIPSGYAQVNYKFGGLAAPTGAEITLGMDISNFAGSPADLGSVMYAAWQDNMAGRFPTTLDLLSVLVKFGPTETGPSAEIPGTGGGNVGSPSAPPNVAYLIRKQTGAGGRAGRGRFYHPGVFEADVNDSGLIGSEQVGIIQTALDAWYDDLTLGDVTPVVLHGAGSPLTTPTPITGFELDPRVATQRRRLRR